MRITVFLSFVLSALVFAGSIGTSIFIHHCSIDGDSHSLFIESEHKCKEEEKKSCCQKQEINEDCCSDEVQTLKSDFEFCNHQTILKFSSISYFVKPNKNFQANNSKPLFLKSVFYYDPPPLLYHSNVLTLNQVFRI